MYFIIHIDTHIHSHSILNTAPKLSPDGKYLTYLAPAADDGPLNVYVRSTADKNNDNARMVTSDASRGIRQYQWAMDSETILFLQDFEVRELQKYCRFTCCAQTLYMISQKWST